MKLSYQIAWGARPGAEQGRVEVVFPAYPDAERVVKVFNADRKPGEAYYWPVVHGWHGLAKLFWVEKSGPAFDQEVAA